jgi:hypothetical protein
MPAYYLRKTAEGLGGKHPSQSVNLGQHVGDERISFISVLSNSCIEHWHDFRSPFAQGP